MSNGRFCCYAFSMSAAAALLGGCGGSQPPIGALGEMVQAPAEATHADPGRSWMLPGTSSDDLLYVTTAGNVVYVLAYPSGKLVGKLTGNGFSWTFGDCVDGAGDVFITNTGLSGGGTSEVVEFAHGGTTPIKALTNVEQSPLGCAVDPVTGNLAVTGYDGTFTSAVDIYANAHGKPTVYASAADAMACTYDSNGNLFVYEDAPPDTFVLQELPYGSQTLQNISVNAPINPFGSGIQWDGKDLAIGSPPYPHTHQPVRIYRVHVSGSSGTVVGKADLKKADTNLDQGFFALDQGKIVQPAGRRADSIYLYKYPKGGLPIDIFNQHEQFYFSMAISHASSHTLLSELTGVRYGSRGGE